MSALSELGAINQILSACGQSPANTLENPTRQWVRWVKAIFDETLRDVQSEGWDFNTERDVTYSSDAVTGEVPIPSSVARFEAHEGRRYIKRGDKVYDREKRTFEIGMAISALIVEILDFDLLPEEAKAYVIKKAARRSYERHVGSNEGLQSLRTDEVLARAALVDQDCDQGNYNWLDDPTIPFSRASAYVPATHRNDPHV